MYFSPWTLKSLDILKRMRSTQRVSPKLRMRCQQSQLLSINRSILSMPTSVLEPPTKGLRRTRVGYRECPPRDRGSQCAATTHYFRGLLVSQPHTPGESTSMHVQQDGVSFFFFLHSTARSVKRAGHSKLPSSSSIKLLASSISTSNR